MLPVSVSSVHHAHLRPKNDLITTRRTRHDGKLMDSFKFHLFGELAMRFFLGSKVPREQPVSYRLFLPCGLGISERK